jgi:tetratricopeptide (TPR) repeat protein
MNYRVYFLDGQETRKIENGIHYNQANAFDSLFIETIILINLYEGRYDEVIKELSSYKFDVFQTQYYYRPKYLYYASYYSLLNKPDLEHIYYDSARIFLEDKIKNLPEDPRLYSSLGIAYAGLGIERKALNASQKAVKILPVEKEAWKGVYLIEDLAYTYVILGKYHEALEKIEYLLSIPGVLSTKILELDPRWAPLKDHPEFKKILEKYTVN